MKIHLLTQNQNLYSSRRILEAGRYRGHEMEPIDYTKFNLTIRSKRRTAILYNGEELPTPDAVIPRVGATNTFFGATVIKQFETKSVFTAVTSNALLASRDKFKCLQLLAMNGIDIPKTAFAGSTQEADALIAEIGGVPLIIKELEGTQGMGVFLAESKPQARYMLNQFQQKKERVLIQEFIAESSGVDIRVIVVGGKVVAAMKRQAQAGEFRSNIHRGGTGTMIELSYQEEQMAISAAATIGLGVAGVDMLLSNKGPLVIEINSSPGLEGIEEYTKLDIAKEIIIYLEQSVQLNK